MAYHKLDLLPTIATSFSEEPLDLINSLLSLENDENNNLIQVLGVVRPAKYSQTSITAIVRGLFTKNKNLLTILNEFSKTFEATTDLDDRKQLFKNFINSFILWVNDDVLLLFQKFRACLENPELADKTSNESTYYNKPIMHLSNYVQFIDSALKLLRHPYIIDQLTQFRNGCKECLDGYLEFLDSSQLNNIIFNQVQLFGETANIKNYADNVCSYFKISQIVERSRNERLILHNSKLKNHIELLLVNLSGLAGQTYNALAVLSIPPEKGSRFLMFPPFRLNELSLSYSNSKCQIILRAVSYFDKRSTNISDTLIIDCPNEEFLVEWVRKLSVIFSLDKVDSPTNPSFLVKLEETPAIKYNGLGINILSDSSEGEADRHHDSVDSLTPESQLSQFRNLVTSPSLRAPSVLSESSSVAFHQPRIPQFVKSSTDSTVSSPTSSFRSAGSIHSYSPTTVAKNLKSSKLQPKTQDFILQDNLQIQNISTGVPIANKEPAERPVSSTAEVEIEDKENEPVHQAPPKKNKPTQQVDAIKSQPAKEEPAKKSGLFQLSTGSEVDISNFGKSHNPSFSVHRGLNELTQNNRPKSKIFGLFKKSKTPNAVSEPAFRNEPTTKPNPKELTIRTDIPMEPSDSDTIPLSATSMTSGVSTVSQNVSSRSFTQEKNASGTAFALPSSTSTYFFKQYGNKSTTSINEELDLEIPQHLKSIINDDESIDFYISPSSPKLMKVSKWKSKYGKWEMLTVNDKLFLKLVVNYQLGQAWLILFKEEFDSKYNEEIDKPIILLNINAETEVSQSSALDVQISSKNSITDESILIMIRCFSNDLCQAVVSNIKNIKGVLTPRSLRHKASQASIGGSKQTIASSVMDSSTPSKSSTMTSVNASLESESLGKPYGVSRLSRDISSMSISSEDINNATILSNPENSRLLMLSNMTIRLQKQLEGYDQINNPSSWKILSMCSLNIHLVSDVFTEKTYYSFELEESDHSTTYKWLICEEEKFERIERIGKAGLLVKASNDELFMIECKGKREFKELSEVF